ncbi:MAG: hypothetical protein PHX08_02565 [Lachnospiraceae bacterium]|nr:hypothetical protein [Lachnospiraceae bacterium]
MPLKASTYYENDYGELYQVDFKIEFYPSELVDYVSNPQFHEICLLQYIKKLMTNLNRVYAAPTEETALIELEQFRDKWYPEYPKNY